MKLPMRASDAQIARLLQDTELCSHVGRMLSAQAQVQVKQLSLCLEGLLTEPVRFMPVARPG